MNVRLYNVTDGIEYCFDDGDKEEANKWEHIAVQFSSPEGITVSCRRARIEFWRV